MQSKNRRVLGILLGLAMALGLVLGVSTKAFADDPTYYYLDASGTVAQITESVTVVDSSTSFDAAGWYVVEGEDVQINLEDGL